MWELLPIQTSDRQGQPYTLIQPDFPYSRSTEVRIATWSEVPADIQAWARSAWEDSFECIRNSVSPTDLFAWIPGIGTLIAKKSRWTDTQRSFQVVFITYIYVHPGNRGQHISTKLVLSLCHECVQRWGIQVFAFEVDQPPPSLKWRHAVPFLSFDYIWVPFFASEESWRPLTKHQLKKYLRHQKGFHTDTYEGWIGYQDSQNNYVILDAHNDIVHYTSLTSVFRCHIPGLRGAYLRAFSQLGSCHVYIENFYFERPTYEHILV